MLGKKVYKSLYVKEDTQNFNFLDSNRDKNMMKRQPSIYINRPSSFIGRL